MKPLFEWFKGPTPMLQKISWVIPAAWVVIKTIFRTLTPDATGIALLMSLADVLSLEFLLLVFTYLFLQLSPHPRAREWLKLSFYVNLAFIPLATSDIAIPLAQRAADAQFPSFANGYDFANLAAATSNAGYVFVVYGPYIWMAVCTIAFLALFIPGEKQCLEMKWYNVIPFAITVALISWALGSVLAGLPFTPIEKGVY